MLVPTLHSLCVKLVTENSGEVRTLLGTSVRQLGHGGRNASHSLFGPLLVGSISGGSRIFEKGFQLLVKAQAQFELKTKKKKGPASTFILLSQQCVMHFYCIISIRTTVIKGVARFIKVRGLRKIVS